LAIDSIEPDRSSTTVMSVFMCVLFPPWRGDANRTVDLTGR
jgi:hypothetical protein